MADTFGSVFGQDNPFLDYLEGTTGGKRSLFFGGVQDQLGGLPTSQRKRAALENVFQDVQNEFLAELGSQALSGEMPTLSFNQYLDRVSTSDRPIGDRIYRQMGSPRTSQFAPRTRFLMNY
tara:strand:- start:149 stop:511 length:363 start_codon:yes stop_codon:yes gene_type:complete